MAGPTANSPDLRPVLGALFLVLVALASGCNSEEEVLADRIVLVSGNNQTGLPGEVLPEPLVVRVLGPPRWDFLGRRGSRSPAENVVVTFEVEDIGRRVPREELSSPGSFPSFPMPYATARLEGPPRSRIEVTTDENGLARVWVRLGRKIGDWRIEAYTQRADSGKTIKEHFRLVSGVRKLREMKEGVVGEEIPLRLELREWVDETEELRPLAGREVYFRLVGEPHGTVEKAEVDNKRDTTDENGIRHGTEVTLGDRAGAYYVLAEVEPARESGLQGSPSESSGSIRGILYRIVAMDWPATIAQLIGGALVFLIGVRFLANGFLLILGPYLHFESGPWTENRGIGYLGGTLIGATFLSWSSIAAHFVSFANGGLLTAHGGLTLLAGASLGATVLPQVLSLQLSFLVLPSIALGWIFLIVPRRRGLEPWGWVLLGAGLVLASWLLLSEGAELLALSDRVRDELRIADVDYSRPFLSYASHWFAVFGIGLIAGFLLRTSNLLVVIAMVLASYDLLHVESGIALIVGANLGSALLLFARTGLKNQEARRLGAVGFLFHGLATIAVAALSLIPYRGSSLWLWSIEWLTPRELFHPTPDDVTRHLALAHTLYNLVAGIIVLAAPRLVTAAVDRLFPARPIATAIKPHRLDDRLIPLPSLALRQATREIVYLTELCQKTVAESFDAFRYGDLGLADQVVRREETIGNLQRDVARYLSLVGENPLSRRDARTLQVLQTAASVLPRIAEAAERLHDLTSRRLEEGIEGSEESDRELSEVYDLVMAQFDNVEILLGKQDPRRQENVMKTVERLAKYRSRLEALLRARIEKNATEEREPVQLYLQALIYYEAFDLLFRTAAHLGEISQSMRTVT